MKRVLCGILALTLLLGGVSMTGWNRGMAEGSHIVVDHAGYEVKIPDRVSRVVVTDVYPMASVIAVFLNSADSLVGIHPVSMAAAKSGLLGELYPEILQADTGFMQGADLNLEALLMLAPDVVFYSAASTELGEKLRGAGFNAVAVSTSKWNYDVLETYSQWTALLGKIFPESDRARRVYETSQEIYEMVQSRVADIPEDERRDVLFLFQYDDQNMVTSGRNFFGQFWCDAVGANNVASGILVDNSNAVINLEQVYAWNPEVIFLTNFTAAQPEDLFSNAIGSDDWSGVRAVQNAEVYKMPLGTYRSYTPGVDTPVTLLWLAKHVYPERFRDVDIEQAVREYYRELYGVELTDAQIARMFRPDSTAGASFSGKK